MSEAERKRRRDYKLKRKKWIIVQTIAILLVILIALSSFLVYQRMNRTYYIHYTENSSVDYQAHLKTNEFYEEEWLDKNHAYVSSLIDYINADFEYQLNMDGEKVSFDYSYAIDAQLVILDTQSGKSVYAPVYELKPEQSNTVSGSDSLTIREQINIDYNKYNDLVMKFISTYQAEDYASSLMVKMRVDVISLCDKFEQDSENTYYVSLNIPLGVDTVNIKTTASVQDESKVLACTNAVNEDIFKVISIVSSCVAAILAIVAVIYIYKTRNEDINYTIKVKRLVSAYRSYIQQINGDFDTTGHQIIVIKTFSEMLGIRDTIQSPILMSENEDKTRTQFFIPTNTSLVYMFEIKVDNYDELYNTENE